jgi:hypothetical protein
MSKRKPPGRGSSGNRRPASKPSPKKTTARKPAAKKPSARKPAAKRQPSRSVTPVEASAPLLSHTGSRTLTPLAEEQFSLRSMASRVNLGDRRTQLTLGAIVTVLALIAAVALWPNSEPDTAQLATDANAAIDDTTAGEQTSDDGVIDTTADDKDAAAGPSGAVKAPTDPAVSNPAEDRAQALKIGAQIRPQSTKYGARGANSWTGVTKDTIKFAIAYDEAACGVNTLTLAQQASANLATSTRFYRAAPRNQEGFRSEFREAAKQLITVVNRRALEGAADFPQIRKLMGNDPTKPFFGRKINYQLIDGGSYQCPETTTAAAIKIKEEIKPFVVINDDALSRAGYNMAAALNAKIPPTQRPMHFGTLHESDALYKKWAPFVWTQFVSGTAHIRQYASWICSRVAGKNAVNSEQYKGTKRKFGLLYPNFQQVRLIANELKTFIKQYCGTNIIASEFAYSTDPARAADEGTSIAVRFKVDGVTSVMYLLDLFAPLFHIIGMSGQDYKPEFVFSGTNYMDSSTVQRLYEQPMVDKASFGITSFGVPGGFGYGAGDPFYAWHDTHKKSPKTGKACDPSSDAGMDHDEAYCKAPGAIVTLYYSVLPMLAGILFAGPDLNPTNVTNGLQAYPQTRYGGAGATTDPRPGLVGAGKGRFYFIRDATEWRWRASFISPPPESKLGWVEWPDCQRHYLLWPNQLAVNWEKNGPNYSKYCGNAKYAPKPYTPSGEPEGTDCADTPAGKCENDNYPPWDPEPVRE